MTNLTLLTFVLLLTNRSFSLSRPQCHRCEQTSCDCSKQNLREVPAAPSKLITKLDLSFNDLSTIMKDDFVAYASLQSLIMNNNVIQTIQEQAFVPLTNLVELDLSSNKLDSLSAEWFKSLVSLQRLNLLGNRYEMLGQGNLFQPLKRLKTLHFGGPDFQSVGKSDFSGLGSLEEVVFDGRNLQTYAEGSLRRIRPLKHVALALKDTKFFLSLIGSIPDDLEGLEEIVLINVDIPQFYNFPALFFLQPLMNVVRRASVINCKVFNVPCESSKALSQLEYIDLSDNMVSDETLGEMMCNGEGSFLSLRTLNLSRNYLQSINSRLFTQLHELENIDMSGNAIHRMPEICFWPPRLHFLNLSSSLLREVTACLPKTLRVLDVSGNALTVFNIKLPLLTKLYISGNKLGSLPAGSLFPRLSFLFVENNDLHTLSSTDLNAYNNLTTIEAGAEMYVCSCDFVAFMTSDLTQHRVAIGDEIKSYVCDSPDAVRGKSVTDARLSVFECHTALALSVLCAAILAVILLVVGLCHKFSVLWYMRMTWAWLKAKRKPKLKKGELEYDAFVSYSEMDSGWVEAHLVPELEQTEPPLRLCLHKRDFLPGGWILDNIMDAIEKSHRTLFVLSQHFVNSEWCKYELDYTHFRLFDRNDDAAVLILLEPIDKETIPKKFCKLRRVMNSRTYLEWPDDDDQIARFWQSLRSAIERSENDDRNDVEETLDL
ncbi:toll-like receptor 2 [Pagrus major]|uniref:toll-like receptor 2 n=1 Tax=Pagrus major TaxID=143350 RepID=UPI003CC8AB5D